MTNAEFDGIRAKMYAEAIEAYPDSRQMDISAMFKLLQPQAGERILGFGEGNGYFCGHIANAVGKTGNYLITDPSKDQLSNLEKKLNLPQVDVMVSGAENLEVPQNSFDKAWSFGAFHHCKSQGEAVKRLYGGLKQGGEMVICDVFQGSALAKHFDGPVARYCITGHEVSFMSDEYAKTLCLNAGFEEKNISIVDLPQKWKFASKEDLGKFIYGLHAMTLIPGTEAEKINGVLSSCEKILGVEYVDGCYELNWPMKALIARK